jgi:hypothetical protein
MDVSAGQEAISLGSIMPIIAKARKLGLVILDACRDNPFGRQMQLSQPGRALAPRGLVPVEPPNSVLVAFAAKHGTTADDGSGRNSPFTTALLHNLETPGLEINYVFRNVHDEVYDATRHQQEPYIYGTLSKEPVYLKAALPTAVSSPAAEAAQAWDAVKQTTSADILQKFINRYGTTIYGDLARERLASIAPAPRSSARADDTPRPLQAALTPAPQASPDRERSSEPDLSIYDGSWTSISTGSCSGLRGPPRRVTIHIKNGAIYDPAGTGRIDPDGSVSGHFTSSGLHGRFWGKMSSGAAGNGSWNNELGCAGVWHVSR